jgi:hypothetical protein
METDLLAPRDRSAAEPHIGSSDRAAFAANLSQKWVKSHTTSSERGQMIDEREGIIYVVFMTAVMLALVILFALRSRYTANRLSLG